MPNGNSAIESVEKILAGTDPIPERVTNQLLLSAIKVNYMTNVCVQNEITEIRKDVVVHDKTLALHGQDITDLHKRSDKWDSINSIVAGVAAMLGIYLGQK